MAFATAARPAALFAALALTAATAAQAPAAFVEDFSTFANDPDTNNLSGAGANLNGWALNHPDRFNVSAGGSLTNGSSGGGLVEKTGGKAHGLDFSDATGVDVNFKMALTLDKSQGQVWLSDANQNGYGLALVRTATENNVAILKLHGANDDPLGTWRNATQVTSSSVPYTAASNDLQGLHLRIEQAAGGGDVTLTVWSDAIADSSYESPLLQAVDTGAGGTFDSAIIDLSSLTNVAFGLDRADASGGAARLDDLRVETVIPEPASAALLGLGGAFVLSRSRAAN